MERRDWTIGFLLFIIVILSLALIDTRLSIQNNINSIEVQPIKEKVLFVGDSITDRYALNTYFDYNDKLIINSGIGGYKTTNIIARFNNLVEQHQAEKLFLMIGTNDLGSGTDPDKIVSNTIEILETIKEKSPNTKIYYESIYPVNKRIIPKNRRNNDDIKYINSKMKEYCEENDIVYLDIYSLLIDDTDNLKEEYTTDGLHLSDEAYALITDYLKPYVEE